jgi:hypothetical protein
MKARVEKKNASEGIEVRFARPKMRFSFPGPASQHWHPDYRDEVEALPLLIDSAPPFT